MDLIKSGKDQGANLVTGGERIGDKGYFIAPTVFADVKDDMIIAREEVSILKYLIIQKWCNIFIKKSTSYFFLSIDIWTSSADSKVRRLGRSYWTR